MPRAEKEAKVREIAAELQGSEAAVLTGYRGLTVQESGDLRGALAEVETRLSVVKNSLAMLAVKEAGLEGLVEMFDGPTAVAYVRGDAVAAAKRMVEQAKRYPVLEIRGGFAEGRILTADDIRSLATLESREVMLAKIAGLGKAQLSRAAFMFQALQSRFLLLLQALKEKMPEEATEAPGPEEAAATEEPGAADEPAEAPAPEEAAETEAAPRAEDPQPDAERPADAPDEESAPDEGGSEDEPEVAEAPEAEAPQEGES
jgi:large subunit ribosomal protein L10